MSHDSLKFRKKPIVIEAVQVTAADYNGDTWDGSPFSGMPKWLADALKDGTVAVEPSSTDYALWRVGTLEDGPDGQFKHIASPGDWIIRGVKGELYPCKPENFALTYEPATSPTDAGLREAAQALVDKLAELHDSDEYKGVWALHEMHTGEYLGPTYTEALGNLQDALSLGRSAPTYMPDKKKTAMYFEAWNEIHCPCGWWVNRGHKDSTASIQAHQDSCPQARPAEEGGS